MVAEAMFHATGLAPSTTRTLQPLGDLEPTTLAIMHGASYRGDGRKALNGLAAAYQDLMTAAASSTPSIGRSAAST